VLNIVDHKLYSGNRIRELRINRPPVNALDLELLSMLRQELTSASESGSGAIVLSGSGGIFSAGLDIKTTIQLDRDGVASTFQALKDVTMAIGTSRIPIAVAITGGCLGAGAIFSVLCDYRVMSRQGVNFGITEVRGGMSVGPHIVYALTQLVGKQKAQKMILESETLDVHQAYDHGLADEVVSHQFVTSRAVAWCDRMLKLPGAAMRSTRNSFRAGLQPMLVELEGESIEDRVDKWFDERVQKNVKKLTKSS